MQKDARIPIDSALAGAERLRAAGRLSEAMEVCAQIDGQTPEPRVKRLIGHIAADAGLWPEAAAAYHQAASGAPGDAESWIGRADALQALERFGEALACYHMALAAQPGVAAAQAGIEACRGRPPCPAATAAPPGSGAFLSVILPTFNRARLLQRALGSLAAQTWPADRFEVLVVDNASTDGTAEMCAGLRATSTNLRYVHEPRPGLLHSRHAGLKAARGDILVYGDDDIHAFPTWLQAIAESFADPAVALVGGKVVPEFESPPPAWVTGLLEAAPRGWYMIAYSVIDLGDQGCEIDPLLVFGCNYAIRRQALIAAGGFHPDTMPRDLLRFYGDGEAAVSRALHASGGKAVFNPGASVYHRVSSERLSLDYVYHRYFVEGITNSYVEVRKNGGPQPAADRDSAAGDLRPPFAAGPEPDLRAVVAAGLRDGFRYHQEQVRQDPELRAFVLKPGYLED